MKSILSRGAPAHARAPSTAIANPQAARSRMRSPAFTLPELLTVIAILMILAALLWPALIRNKDAALRAQCISNERQLMLAWQMYSDDTGRLPNNGYVRGGGGEIPMWVQGYYNHQLSFSDCTNTALLVDPRYAQFADYLRRPQIYKCPADRARIQAGAQSFAKVRSYAMNWYMGWVRSNKRNPPEPAFRLESAILSPSAKFVFLDLNAESICWPFFGVETNDVIFMMPAAYHSGGANVAFADGHVIHHRWQDRRTRSPSEDLVWHDHRHASLGNPDLEWMRWHAVNGPAQRGALTPVP